MFNVQSLVNFKNQTKSKMVSPLKFKTKNSFINEYRSYLEKARFSGRVVFCYWESSGSPFIPLPPGKPWLLYPLIKALDFKSAEKKAKDKGRSFIDSIFKKYGDLRGNDIFLIGHSLGTLLIHEALTSGNEKRRSYFPLKDVIYLASAVPEIDYEEWSRVLASMKGNIFLAYSPKDIPLDCTPDFKKRIGKIRLNHASDRIVDVHCKNYGHNDYLERMRRVLRKWHFRTHSSLSMFS